MKIHFESSGGFAHLPAVNRPFVVDTSEVDSKEAKELESLVHAAEFFDKRSPTTVSRGAADYITYTITVEDGARSHTIQLTDPLSDPALHTLVSHLRNLSHPSKQNRN
jgi:hypothetical protein